MDAFSFLDFGILDALDILLVAALLYYIYKLIRGTVAINIFLGIAILYLIWRLTDLLGMVLLSDILGKFLGGGFIALIIVFQQEIRKFLLMIGSSNFATKKGWLKQLRFFSNFNQQQGYEVSTDIDSIIKACEDMSKTKTGALIVIERNNNLEIIKQTGDKQKAQVNKEILKSIFYKNSPLHDGAVVIEDNFITATRVILPVEKDLSMPTRFGLRHRAALGITLRYDAVALVVSEETGQISYLRDGEFVLFDDTEHLRTLLLEDLA